VNRWLRSGPYLLDRGSRRAEGDGGRFGELFRLVLEGRPAGQQVFDLGVDLGTQ
jgi:hypothetical protein